MHPVKILGVGTPILDLTWILDTDIFLGKGLSTPISREEMEQLYHQYGPPLHQCPGGSAANVIRSLGDLGVSTAFFGEIGQDTAGALCQQSFIEAGTQPLLKSKDFPTAQVACLVTPDGERTMKFTGVSTHALKLSDLNPQWLIGVTHAHLEGYLVSNPTFLKGLLELFSQHQIRVSYDLGSAPVVAENKAFIQTLLPHIDTLFGNEDEMQAFIQKTPREATQSNHLPCPTIVAFEGVDGAHIRHHGTYYHQPSIPANVVDTTGAGDAFASGFLFGHTQGWDLERSSHLGAHLASQVVQVYGPSKRNYEL